MIKIKMINNASDEINLSDPDYAIAGSRLCYLRYRKDKGAEIGEL